MDYIENSVFLTHAHSLITSGLKAVVADAAITALCVNTLAMTAHVRDLLALVTVCGEVTEKRSSQQKYSTAMKVFVTFVLIYF